MVKSIRIRQSDLYQCSEDYVGFCLACGEQNGPVEPDARRYECEACEKPMVYGFDELMLMGAINVVADDAEADF